MENNPFVSIVIPTYRRADHLDRLLSSISAQSYKFFEVIIVDDASPNIDEYNKVITKFEGLFDEITFHKKLNNSGAPNSRNIGISLSKYDWIAFVDDDDEWLPEKLANQVLLLHSPQSHLGIIYSWTDAINAQSEVVHEYREIIEGYCLPDIMNSCFIPSPSVLIKKSAIQQVGGFDENMPSCQDWDTWVRIIFNGYAVQCSRTVDVIYHKHEGPTIGTSSKARTGYLMFYRKHFLKLVIYKPRYIVRWLKLEITNTLSSLKK